MNPSPSQQSADVGTTHLLSTVDFFSFPNLAIISAFARWRGLDDFLIILLLQFFPYTTTPRTGFEPTSVVSQHSSTRLGPFEGRSDS